MSAIPRSAFGARVRERLASESVISLVTVGMDGTPQPNPVWFWWQESDPDSLLIYNRAGAHRLDHVAARPNVSLHFDADARGMDVVVFTGAARRAGATPRADEHHGYRAKYERSMPGISGNVEAFGAEYPVALEVTVRRVRGF